jgi:hypothetical protein
MLIEGIKIVPAEGNISQWTLVHTIRTCIMQKQEKLKVWPMPLDVNG